MSERTAYAPAPGTIAFRALAHLETLPAGAEMMTSALAEAIGAAALNVAPCLEAPLRYGLIHRRQRDNHARSPYWWSLTDHSRAPKADIRRPAVPSNSGTAGLEPAADGSQKPNGGVHGSPAKAGRGHPQNGANRDATGFEGNGASAPDATDCEARSKVMAAGGSESPTARGTDGAPALGAAPAFHFRCALWSNGVLQIDRTTVGGAAEHVLLSADETRELVRYLDRLRVEEGA